MQTPLPAAIVHRLKRVREDAQRASGELDAHARDLMMEAPDAPALAHVQLVKSLVDEAIMRLDQALREAGPRS